MEQKMIYAMQLKRDVLTCAIQRQISIKAGDYQSAMSDHFYFLMYADEWQALRYSMTNKEADLYLEAQFCLDYRNL